MAEGDLDAVFSLYDPEAVFLNQSRELKKGEELKQELAPFAAMKLPSSSISSRSSSLATSR